MEDLYGGWCSSCNEIFTKEGFVARLTVTGKTIAENLTVPDLNDGQDVIHKIQKALKVEISDPLWKSSHRGCVAKKLSVNILKVMPLFMKMNTK
jgi:dihydroxy-acid dehydratase